MSKDSVHVLKKSSKIEMLLMHVKSLGDFIQRTFWAFHLWHEGAGNIIETPQHDRGSCFQWDAWKGRLVFLRPFRGKTGNWLKCLLSSYCLLPEVIGIYELFMVCLCWFQLHTKHKVYFFLTKQNLFFIVFSLFMK